MFNIQALSVFLLATLAVATPTVPTYHYNPAIKTTPFTDKTCKLSKTVAPGAAFTNSYPVANSLGGQVSRALRMDIGPQLIQNLDAITNELCVNAQSKPNAGNGICQDAQQVIKDIVNTKSTHAAQGHAFHCLFNMICSANVQGDDQQQCDSLSWNIECIANRIAGTIFDCPE